VESPIRIVGISGSLRAGSHNTAALRAAAEMAPDGVEIEIFDLNGLPMFNADTEADDLRHPKVAALREAIGEADGVLIATPEYNYSVTGALKNAIDWASRGGADAPLNGKPAAVLGAGGRFGTVRAQMHLREILRHNDVRLVGRPEVMIDRASTKFEAGRLVDERHRDQVRRLVEALAALVRERHRSLTLQPC
jgi:chromate reductase